MYDIQPFARNITSRTGITFTFTHENGLTVIRGQGRGLPCRLAGGGPTTPSPGWWPVLCALPLADSPCKDALRDLNTLLPHGDHLGRALGIAQEEPVAGPLTVAFTLLGSHRHRPGGPL